MDIGLTARYGVKHPADAPRWGLVVTLTLIFPR